ncbi:uncharacterized protein MELLADRAFT_95131 [Melampsora larici-populina 98AG31]|uniref:ABC transmembrane type-1 domain-containing protein n=1 Tax=Melampsora larici-populina (strain 98AG31 / pathotype 3-4-7) TaxID=747676 RepID=F4RC77_MELLP|nr:uncharacterized protein MELLADRAFT_95131 [Melampsora larici-populina 98AG31]EGG09689.1 hypothetical protein MELLADRAFT_95131 [Melampsora larici-populina 98AG31]
MTRLYPHWSGETTFSFSPGKYWILLLMSISVPATYTNLTLSYLQCELWLAYRTWLTNHIHDLYL